MKIYTKNTNRKNYQENQYSIYSYFSVIKIAFNIWYLYNLF